MSASNYLEDRVLNHVLRVTSFSQPAGLWLALFTGTAGENLESNIITNEVSGGSYARRSITFAAAVNGVSANSASIEFPVATAAWGTITHVAILDSSSLGSGNVLFWGALGTPKTIGNTDLFQIGATHLTVTLN
jgi:hypothetical protein